jgi:phytoene dehydrogenase-like protein
MSAVDVVVIGGGISGLATAKACLVEGGFSTLLIEQTDRLGEVQVLHSFRAGCRSATH